MTDRPPYLRVFLTFARNSLVRDMTFRSNFIIESITSLLWMGANLAFYILIFTYTPRIGLPVQGSTDPGWGKYQFLIFFGTAMMINSLVQAFFMINAEEFSEKIRTGTLDFALVQPIDTQFLISLHRIKWASLANFGFGAVLICYSLGQLGYLPTLAQIVLYPIYILCGVAIMYSLMITLAATSVWMGRNQSLYNFWFYITNFSRYPMEIYNGRFGTPLQQVFTFAIPILIAINIPARLMAKPLEAQNWPLVAFALVATAGSLILSRWLFNRSLLSYRSASS